MVQIKVPPTLAKIASLWVKRPFGVFKRRCELKVCIFKRCSEFKCNLMGFKDR
jgi:hypothetical protein